MHQKVFKKFGTMKLLSEERINKRGYYSEIEGKRAVSGLSMGWSDGAKKTCKPVERLYERYK